METNKMKAWMLVLSHVEAATAVVSDLRDFGN